MSGFSFMDGGASAHDTIPYEAMWPDGLCRLGNGLYSMSILFQDINYRIASDDEQESAFNSLKDFYNALDPSYGLQLTILKYEEDRSAFTSNLKTDGMDPEVAAYGREYTIKGDLAITYHLLIDVKDWEIGSAMITNQILDQLGVSKDQLHVDAMENSPKILPARIEPLVYVILGSLSRIRNSQSRLGLTSS